MKNKYVMRFPTASHISQWIHFKSLEMRRVDAHMKVEQWSPNVGAKGVLQQAWFRVWDIPPDQRSVRTVAKVGGLVGKVLEIDESTRLRNEYVRVRIACRDITKVPKKAESTLGLFLHDFTFEREVEVDGTGKTLSGGIKVGDKDYQPSPKKHKTGDFTGQSSIPHAEKSTGKFSRMESGQGRNQERVAVESTAINKQINVGGEVKYPTQNLKGKAILHSAPPKLEGARYQKSEKLMGEAKKPI